MCLNGLATSDPADEHAKQHEEISSFEKALEELYLKKPYLRNLLSPGQTDQKPATAAGESWPDYEKCKKAIDWIAMTSACVRIYLCHKNIVDGPALQEDMVDKALLYAPEFIQRICKQSRFFKDSVDIALETIILKTVARMILYCLKGDGFDLIKSVISKAKKWTIG